ncbi:MAG: zf-HC2 domain-containing protein [Pirellulaceae bacterium]
MKLTCKQLYDFMGDYLEGNLPPETMCVVKTHLERCPCCLHYLENYHEATRLGIKVCQEEEKDISANVPEELVRAILDARGKDDPKP